MLSRSLACVAAIGLVLPASSARAEGPPPGAHAPPPGYLPYPPPQAEAPTEPYTPMKRRSSGMIGAGIVLISLSTVGLIAGTALFAGGSVSSPVFNCPPGFCSGFTGPDNSALKPAGIASIAVGIAALGAGIPLLVVGSQKVPDRDEAVSLVPALRVGAGRVSASWRF